MDTVLFIWKNEKILILLLSNFKQKCLKIGYDIDERKMEVEKIIKYKKSIIIIVMGFVIGVIIFGVYILQTTLNNLNYSKSEAHVIALKQFPGTIISSQIEYEQMQIFYEIDVENQQQEKIEITISGKSGKVVGYEYKEG